MENKPLRNTLGKFFNYFFSLKQITLYNHCSDQVYLMGGKEELHEE